ncbi:MAG TPA: SRPBCC family protein [Pseudonocardiaceae bacterium]|nr:SRPBCC family protein [Pseudonocardiaceae bacterium]
MRHHGESHHDAQQQDRGVDDCHGRSLKDKIEHGGQLCPDRNVPCRHGGGTAPARTTIDIDATPETIWSVLVDVELWPSWTASTSSVTRLDSGAFGVGSAARVKQPRLPAAVWRVTAFEHGTSFTWVARSPGLATSARHTLVPRAGGGVTVVLEVS